MITHIVMFRLIDPSMDNLNQARDILEGMAGKIPFLRSLEVGIDMMHTSRSFDIALITRFDSWEDLKSYQVHPAHLEVSAQISSLRESSASVDYEFNY